MYPRAAWIQRPTTTSTMSLHIENKAEGGGGLNRQDGEAEICQIFTFLVNISKKFYLKPCLSFFVELSGLLNKVIFMPSFFRWAT